MVLICADDHLLMILLSCFIIFCVFVEFIAISKLASLYSRTGSSQSCTLRASGSVNVFIFFSAVYYTVKSASISVCFCGCECVCCVTWECVCFVSVTWVCVCVLVWCECKYVRDVSVRRVCMCMSMCEHECVWERLRETPISALPQNYALSVLEPYGMRVKLNPNCATVTTFVSVGPRGGGWWGGGLIFASWRGVSMSRDSLSRPSPCVRRKRANFQLWQPPVKICELKECKRCVCVCVRERVYVWVCVSGGYGGLWGGQGEAFGYTRKSSLVIKISREPILGQPRKI